MRRATILLTAAIFRLIPTGASFLSDSPLTPGGTTHVTEAVRQLRGAAGERQIERNRTVFVNGNGGIMSTQCSLILGKEKS